MCGLVACISKKKYGFNTNDSEIFDQLLYTGALRGEDSTGMFYVNKYGNLYTLKSAQRAAVYQDTKTYADFLKAAYLNGRIMVGHNRAATKGEKIDKNAHPFISDNICLVHNGTLYNHKSIADTDVDSHALAMGFSTKGYKETLDKAFGAYALIWYNAEEKTLRIARNSERPLWMIDTKDAIYIASEADMLSWIVGRNLKEKVDAPTFFATDKIYSWKLDTQQTAFYSEKYEKKAVAATILTKPQTGLLPTTKGGTQTARLTTKPNKGQLVYKTYRVGDVVNFTNDNVFIVDHKLRIDGVCTDDLDVKVRGYLDSNQISSSLEIEITQADFLNGTVSGVVKRDNDVYLLVDDIKPDWVVYTCDGKAVTYDMLDNIDMNSICCHECGSFVDLIDDSGKFWARIKNGIAKSFKCPECATKNPHIKKENSDD